MTVRIVRIGIKHGHGFLDSLSPYHTMLSMHRAIVAAKKKLSAVSLLSALHK